MQCQMMRPQSKKLLQPDTAGLLLVCTVQNTWNIWAGLYHLSFWSLFFAQDFCI